MSSKQDIERLKQTIKITLGNKRYMRSLDNILDKLPELDHAERDALRYLAQDLQHLYDENRKNKNGRKNPIF